MIPDFDKQVYGFLDHYAPYITKNHTVFKNTVIEELLIYLYGEKETERIFKKI